MSKVVSSSQLLNILDIFVTFLVSKPFKFKILKFLHPQNMPYIFVTFPVSKLLISNFLSSLQYPNIRHIFVTSDASKPVKSTSVKFSHPSNI